jgi:hypothetical protein
MIVFIIIITYIFNIFLNRFLNKILYKIDEYQEPSPILWFLPLISTIAYIAVILAKIEFPTNWFTGKNWNK